MASPLNEMRDAPLFQVRKYIVAGFALIALFAGTVGVWAAVTELAGAVVAAGMVVVDNMSKKVQHPTGGVVGELLVKEGDAVEAGQVVMRLDDTVTRANLALVTKQLDEIAIRTVRLIAEIEGKTALAIPADISGRKAEPHIAASLSTELALFESRVMGRAQQIGQLRERIVQLRQQADGVAAQEKARRLEVELAAKERDALGELEDKNLVNIAKITAARRTVAQLEGNLSETVSQGAQVRAKITETELQILEVQQNAKSEAGKDLREQQVKQAELSERRVAAEDQLRRVDIRSPQAGIVHQLSVHTLGGVVAPGEAIMLVVPKDERLVVEARIAPQDIDQIKVGAPARIRFSAFNVRTTPEFKATVTRVSADLVVDPGKSASGQAGASYYTVRVALNDPRDLKDLKLVPGMPTEVHITTEERTAFTYLAKPLVDQFRRAFRER